MNRDEVFNELDLWNIRKIDLGRVVKYTLTDARTDGPQYERLPQGTKVTEWLDGVEQEAVVCKKGQFFFVDKYGELRLSKEPAETKGDCLKSVKRSFSRLRDLIMLNADNPAGVLMVTFTYDPKRLRSELTLKKVSNDMRNAFRDLREFSPFEYIYVVEQQGNGNWHSHALLFHDGVAPYYPQGFLESCWRHGFVKISRRFDDGEIDNIGSYVVADLTYGTEKGEHGAVKNERLYNYPAYARLYRCSRGIKRPEKVVISDDVYASEVSQLDEPFYQNHVVRGFDRDNGFVLDVPRNYVYQTFLK